MRIYRVERKFCTRREDLKTVARVTKESMKHFLETGESHVTLTPSWNKEPRSPYGWVGTDNSAATIEWMDLHGIDQGNFRHVTGNEPCSKRPTPGSDKSLMCSVCKHFGVSDVKELPKGFQKAFRFGFESELAFKSWFEEDDLEILRSKGYYIAVYEVCNNSVLLGDTQLMFKTEGATQVDFILI